MIRREAVQNHRLENYLRQNCVSWHTFARSLDIRIGFGDVMLVTECSKTAAWSSAVYSNSSTEFSLSFSVGLPFSAAGIGAWSSLAKIGPIERRRSQRRALPQSSPLPNNHTVFVKAYRLGIRQSYYYSLVSLFIKARGSTETRGSEASTNEAALSTTLASSQNALTPPGMPESIIMQPYTPVCTILPLNCFNTNTGR
jgi:hypothetical protein